MRTYMASGEVAERLGINRRHVSNLVRSGALAPAARAGRVNLFDPETVDALASQRSAS